MADVPKSAIKPAFRPKTKASAIVNSYSATSEDKPEILEKFVLTDKGWYYDGNERIFICSPLCVVADPCTVENNQRGKLLEFSVIFKSLEFQFAQLSLRRLA